MAYYFGINNGAGIMGNVLEQATTTSRDVEVVITTNANIPSKAELLLALQKIEDYIVYTQKNW